jgi:hypothetical protein
VGTIAAPTDDQLDSWFPAKNGFRNFASRADSLHCTRSFGRIRGSLPSLMKTLADGKKTWQEKKLS